MKKYIVLIEFADKNNIAKHYQPGDELPGEFGEDRLANVVKLGLAKVEDTEAGNGNGNDNGNNTGAEDTVTDIDLTAKVAEIIPQVKKFTDVEKLKQYLETEKSAAEPRKTVVKAIEDRLANIVKE
ncbi:MAG: hypothetical protein LBS01_01040 [Prevotellaceae bacterium]|jgi:hypothetical protein|nr:hypothetical protein [Prevotellaceae bacterium]